MNQEIDQHNIIRPAEHKFLLDYLYIVREQYKYISLLDTGIDTRENAAAKPTSHRFFVDPTFCERYIDPTEDASKWPERLPLKQILEQDKYKKLFLLGDPGVGKTTLSNRISVVLAQFAGVSSEKFPIVPILITLRDYDYTNVKSWDDLLKLVLSQKVFQGLNFDEGIFEQLLKNGQGFILLDGLDEVSNPTMRKQLSSAVLEGLQRYPDCRWWFTSRIVGFDQAKFWVGEDAIAKGDQDFRPIWYPSIMNETVENLDIESKGQPKETNYFDAPGVFAQNLNEQIFVSFESEKNPKDIENKKIINSFYSYKKGIETLIARTYLLKPNHFEQLYVAPFDDSQTRQFMTMWYDFFETDTHRRSEQLELFLTKVKINPAVVHLTRIPNLLAMMALYFEVNQNFPDGRYTLYRSIAEAYMVKIRQRRNLGPSSLNFPEEIKCFSALAYQMQENRVKVAESEHFLLTISREDAEKIFLEALKGSAMTETELEKAARVHAYFDGLNRRADILIPRSANKFGFLHLSYQEFFAAEYLKDKFLECTGYFADKSEGDAFFDSLKQMSAQVVWHETLILFFESFLSSWDNRPELMRAIFERVFEDLNSTNEENRAQAAIKILTNEFIGNALGLEQRWAWLDRLIATTFVWQDLQTSVFQALKNWGAQNGIYKEIISELTDMPTDSDQVRWLWIKSKSVKGLAHSLPNLTFLKSDAENFDVETLVKYSLKLLRLDVGGCQSLSNLTLVESLPKLLFLDCSSTQISDLGPLKNLQNLQNLGCNSTQISDLGPLKNLQNLQTLLCESTQIIDLTPVNNLKNLQALDLGSTPIKDLKPVNNLKNLRFLNCGSTQVSDLKPLKNLQNLTHLFCGSTPIKDLAPLENLQNLKTLYFWSTKISDLRPLKNLKNLRLLYFWSTKISDLKPLENLTTLQALDCSSTQISDLGPLKNLQNLQNLGCNSTQISDLTPLKNLKNLQNLDCYSTQISDLSPLKNLKNLQNLDCYSTQISDLSPLKNLKNLQNLDCYSTQISDLSPLKNLKNLENLNCISTQISDLEPLKNLKNLKTLNCSSTQISDLGPLKNLQNLKTLNCSSTQISDLEPLKNLKNLKTLNCSSTQISDLGPLKNLQNLKTLNCSSTQISDLGPLKNLQNLQNLNCSNTNVTKSEVAKLQKALPNLTIEWKKTT